MTKTLSQLVREHDRLEKQIAIAKKRESEGVIKRIREAIAIYGITADDLYGGHAKPKTTRKVAAKKSTRKPRQIQARTTRAKVKTKVSAKASPRKRPVKYTDGTNTWAGGGSMPRWLREKIDAGATLDSFLVVKAA